MARRSRRRSMSVNFEGVSTEGGARIKEEGEYLLEVEACEAHSSQKNEGLKWTFKVAKGDFKGAKVRLYTMFNPESLWKLRQILEALGNDIPDSEYDIQPDEYVGQQMMGEIYLERFEGKKTAKLGEFWPTDGKEEEEDDTVSKSRGRKGDNEDEDERSRRSRSSRAKVEEDEEEKVKPRRRARDDDDEEEEERPARSSAKRASSKDDEEEDEEEDDRPTAKRASRRDEEDEDEDTDRRQSKKTKKNGRGNGEVTEDDVRGMSQSELEDLVEELSIDVDLSEFSSLRKMRDAVVKAM